MKETPNSKDQEKENVASSNEAINEGPQQSVASIVPPTYELNKTDEKTQDSDKSSTATSKESSVSDGDDDSGSGPLDIDNKLKKSGIQIIKESSKAQELNARAFAQGNTIHFAPGEYNDSKSGRELLGHELAHVIQNKKGQVKPNKKIKGKPVNDDPTLESEADAQGKDFASGDTSILQNLEGVSGGPHQLKSEETIQRFPSFGDIVDGVVEIGSNTIDAIGDAASWVADESLELALKVIDNVEDLINFLAGLSSSVAKFAIEYVAKNMRNLFVKLIQQVPGHELIQYGMKVIVEMIGDVGELIDFVGQFSHDTIQRLLGLIQRFNPEVIKRMILGFPGSIVSAIGLLVMTPAKIAQVLLELGVDSIVKLIKTSFSIGLGIVRVLSALVEFSVEKTIEIFKALGAELIEQLGKAYGIVLQIIKKIVDHFWPVGVGYNIEAGLGATFVVPVYAGVNYLSYLQRTSDDIFHLYRKGVVKLGGDIGEGVGVSFGGSDRPGEKGFMAGFEAGAAAGAGFQFEVEQKFDFPIFEDLAFLSMMATVTGSESSAPFMLTTMMTPDQLNLDPMGYNTSTQFKAGVYAEAAAEASGGIRVGENSTNGARENWERHEERPQELGGTSGGPWYAPGMLLRKLNASAGADISIGAGFGLEMEQFGLHENAEGVREPEEVEMSIFGEGNVAANIQANLPFIPLPGVGFDNTLGLKVTYKFNKSANGDIEAEYKSYSIYHQSGEIDRVAGLASESELEMTGNPLDFENFLNNIQSFRRSQRLGIEGGIGRSLARRSGRQEILRHMNSDGLDSGVSAGAYLNYEFIISKNNLRRLFTTIQSFYNDRFADGEWQYTTEDIINVFRTGTIPGYLEEFIDEILSSINVTELSARIAVGGGIAGDVSAAFGLKARLHGNLSVGRFSDYDLLQGDEQLTFDDLRQLLASGSEAIGFAESDTSNPETTPSEELTPTNEVVPDSTDQTSSIIEAQSEVNTELDSNELIPESVVLENESVFSPEEIVNLNSVKYELFAHGMAYKNELDPSQNTLLENMGFKRDWAGTVDTNDDTGFFAGLILPDNRFDVSGRDDLSPEEKSYFGSNRAVIAFRGSETSNDPDKKFTWDQFLLDWVQNDMDPYAVGHTAFNLHTEDIEKMLKIAVTETGQRVVVVGHSLGGSLAKQCALYFPQYVEEVYTYQAPGISADQEQTIRDNPGSTANILGDSITEEEQAQLDQMLYNEQNTRNGIEDIEVVSHTSTGDIVQNAGGGRIPHAERRHHNTAGLINGNTPVSHALFLTSSSEFQDNHESFNQLVGNEINSDDPSDHARTLFTQAHNNNVNPNRINANSEITDSTAYENTELARQLLVGNVFNPQATLLINNPSRIVQIPQATKVIIMNQLMRPTGLPLVKKTMDLAINHDAIVNMFTYSSPEEQRAMINAQGGLGTIYNRIDGLYNNIFNDRTSTLRLAISSTYIPSLSHSETIKLVETSLDSGFLGIGDNSEEKILVDILFHREDGRAIITAIGKGDYDEGLDTILGKVQFGQDKAIRSKYSYDVEKKWWQF